MDIQLVAMNIILKGRRSCANNYHPILDKLITTMGNIDAVTVIMGLSDA